MEWIWGGIALFVLVLLGIINAHGFESSARIEKGERTPSFIGWLFTFDPVPVPRFVSIALGATFVLSGVSLIAVPILMYLSEHRILQQSDLSVSGALFIVSAGVIVTLAGVWLLLRKPTEKQEG